MNKMREWGEFWEKNMLNTVDVAPFVHNLDYMIECLNKHYCVSGDNIEFPDLTSLEVGCGRGVLSDSLHACSIDAYKIDKYHTPWNKDNFKVADVFDMPFPRAKFDIAFTYGLLEHYDFKDQMEIIKKMMYVTKPGGINIHYVVPKKLTNLFENTELTRCECEELRVMFDCQWVFPIINFFGWKTNKWFGKGFFITVERGIGYEFDDGCFTNIHRIGEVIT